MLSSPNGLWRAIVLQITMITLFIKTYLLENGRRVCICVSLRLLGLLRSKVLDTMDCCHPHSLANIPPFSLLDTHTLIWYMHCHTLWLFLVSAFLTEWAEHRWGWSHACCQGTWNTLTPMQRHTRTHTNVTQHSWSLRSGKLHWGLGHNCYIEFFGFCLCFFDESQQRKAEFHQRANSCVNLHFELRKREHTSANVWLRVDLLTQQLHLRPSEGISWLEFNALNTVWARQIEPQPFYCVWVNIIEQ